MPEYRRSRMEGGTYFFTIVTYKRLPLFHNESARRLLHNSWFTINIKYPFETVAVCLLPDHLHCIWHLPEGDADYSKRWRGIKGLFTIAYLKEIGTGEERNLSRQKRREAALWQRRFWEHTIEGEEDLETHLDYIHFNPVKHGYVKRPVEWK